MLPTVSEIVLTCGHAVARVLRQPSLIVISLEKAVESVKNKVIPLLGEEG